MAIRRRRWHFRPIDALAIASLVLLAFAGYLYYESRQEESPQPVAPSPVAGIYQLIHVQEALQESGIDADFGRGTLRTDLLDPPAQILDLGDGATLYVFIYPDRGAREAALPGDDLAQPESLELRRPSGTPVPTQGLTVIQGANLIVALSGGSSETLETVRDSIENLP